MRVRRDRPDEVVRLEAGLLEDREAEQPAEALGVLDLRDEIVRHRLSLGLVRRVHLLAERLLVAVEADGDTGRLAVRHVLPPHVEEAQDRVRRPPAGPREPADRVEGAVEIVRGVDERERGPFRRGRHRGESIRGACQNRRPVTEARGDAAVGAIVFAALSLLGQHSWGTVDAIQRFAVTRALVESGSAVTPEFGPVKYGPLQSVLMIPTYLLGKGLGALAGSDPRQVGYRTTAFLFSPLVVTLLCVVFRRAALPRGGERARGALRRLHAPLHDAPSAVHAHPLLGAAQRAPDPPRGFRASRRRGGVPRRPAAPRRLLRAPRPERSRLRAARPRPDRLRCRARPPPDERAGGASHPFRRDRSSSRGPRRLAALGSTRATGTRCASGTRRTVSGRRSPSACRASSSRSVAGSFSIRRPPSSRSSFCRSSRGAGASVPSHPSSRSRPSPSPDISFCTRSGIPSKGDGAGARGFFCPSCRSSTSRFPSSRRTPRAGAPSAGWFLLFPSSSASP